MNLSRYLKCVAFIACAGIWSALIAIDGQWWIKSLLAGPFMAAAAAILEHLVSPTKVEE